MRVDFHHEARTVTLDQLPQPAVRIDILTVVVWLDGRHVVLAQPVTQEHRAARAVEGAGLGRAAKELRARGVTESSRVASGKSRFCPDSSQRS